MAKVNVEKLIIQTIRFMGISLGLMFTLVVLWLIIFSSRELPVSFYERLWAYFPYLIFGIILVIPYKYIKDKVAAFYLLLIVFILLVIGFIFWLYRGWVSDSIGPTFKLDVANLLPVGAFVIFVANIWAFLKITKKNLIE